MQLQRHAAPVDGAPLDVITNTHTHTHTIRGFILTLRSSR